MSIILVQECISGIIFQKRNGGCQKKRKEMIVKAELKIDDQNLLDLTDTAVCDLLEKLLEKLDHVLVTTYNIKSVAGVKNCLGREIDALFDGFQRYLGRFSVVKGRRYYDKKRGSSFLQNTNLTDKSVDIFSARRQEAIGKKQIVEK